MLKMKQFNKSGATSYNENDTIKYNYKIQSNNIFKGEKLYCEDQGLVEVYECIEVINGYAYLIKVTVPVGNFIDASDNTVKYITKNISYTIKK